MSCSQLCLSIPVSILSYLNVELPSELLFLKIAFNLGAPKMKFERGCPT